MNAHHVLPVVVFASIPAGLLLGLLAGRKRWWLAGLAIPIAVILWPRVAGDDNRSWSGGDITYQVAAVFFALEILAGFYLALGIGFGFRHLVHRFRRRPVAP